MPEPRRDSPILFSAPMIRALLAGEKTETRRVLKPQPINIQSAQRMGAAIWCAHPIDINQPIGFSPPIQRPGDRLWVREAWTFINMDSERQAVCVGYQADGPDLPNRPTIPVRESVIESLWRGDPWMRRRRPSIHMPREFSRITLLVRDVRVERLQEITDAGCVAEGAPVDAGHRHTTQDGSGPPMVRIGSGQWRTVRAWYHCLWDELHTRDGYGWDANPFVFVTSFQPFMVNIDSLERGLI